jgi:hypothetical protein
MRPAWSRRVLKGSWLRAGPGANRLEEVEAGLAHETGEVYTIYGDAQRDTWATYVLPVLAAMPMNQLVAAGVLKESALREIRAGRARPHPSARGRLESLAEHHARGNLSKRGCEQPHRRLAVLHAHQQLIDACVQPDRCAQCDDPLRPGRSKYCGPACKQRAYSDRLTAAAPV